MGKLSDKQEKFAESIAVGEFDYNWLAYEKYYDCTKMSKNAIYVEACKLIQNPKVAQRIAEIRDETIKRNQSTLDEVLIELSKWLRFNLKSIFNEDGTMKQIHEMTEDEAACIASYEVLETTKSGEVVGVLRKVKLIDKLGSADKLLRKMGAYIENKNVKFDKDSLEHLRDILEEII